MYKVLIADKIKESAKDIIEKANMQVDLKPGLSEEEIIKIIPEYDAILVRSVVKVTKNIINAGTKLKIIGRAGVGVDNIDIESATEKGIVVMNTPFGNINAAAEHTITLLMLLAKHVIHSHHSMKKGEWDRKKFIGTEVKDKTLGIIGLGKVGEIVSKVTNSLGMKILVHDPFIDEKKAKDINAEKVELDVLLKNSDYITVHVPLNDKTKNMINKDAFKKMKQGVKILNVARGGIVNEKDLLQAINQGKVDATAIDVWEQEPPLNRELVENESVIATPHLGASTKEAQENVALDLANQVVEALNNNNIANAVNDIKELRKD